MLMQVAELESGNTQITVDAADLELLRTALWNQQVMLVDIMRKYPDHRGRLWQELNERWLPMARALGAGILFSLYDQIVRKGVEVPK